MSKRGTRSLLDPDVLQKLEDETYFVSALDEFYKSVAALWGCEVQMSGRRLGDAYACWMDDADRTVTHGFREAVAAAIAPAPKKLDHFKVASIIAFWLRRSCPINETYPLSPGFSPEALRDFNIDTDRHLFDDLTTEQAHYLDFGNELTAIFAGFQIVLGGQISRYEQRLKERREALRPGARLEILAGIEHSRTFLWEYPRLFKPWHAVFMNYHSLFERLKIVHD